MGQSMAVSTLLRRVGRLLTNPSEGDQLVFIGKGDRKPPKQVDMGLNLTVESADKSIRKKEAAGTVIPSHLLAFSGARCRTRTCDLRLRRPTLYPAELIALEHSSSRKIFPRRGTVNHSAAGASSPGRPKAPGLSLSRRRRCRPPVRPRRPRARRRGPPGGIRPRWGR